MEAAEHLTATQRARAKRDAIWSACWGALSGVTIQDSAIIILFSTLIGASDMLSMVTTSLQGLASCFLLIPAAYLAGQLGYKKTIIWVSAVGMVMIMALATVPWFGEWSKPVLLISIIVFSICMTAYAAAWFPLLDGFLLKDERGEFFGVMRFSWQTFAALFCFGCGFIIGEPPRLWMLQLIIAVAALGLLGRIYYIARIPDRHQVREKIALRAGIAESLSNTPLTGFSIYICCLYLAAYSTTPLAFIYLKKYLLVPDNILVIISALVLAGTILGFLSAGKIIDKLDIKRMLLLIHFFFALVNLILFFIGANTTFNLVLLTCLLATYGFFIGCSSIAVSTEMMALASPHNKAISMAFCGSCCAAGIGGSRLLASLILGSGMLAPQWFIGAMKISHYQTLFLAYACAILVVCLLLVLVPTIFPKGENRYLANEPGL